MLRWIAIRLILCKKVCHLERKVSKVHSKSSQTFKMQILNFPNPFQFSLIPLLCSKYLVQECRIGDFFSTVRVISLTMFMLSISFLKDCSIKFLRRPLCPTWAYLQAFISMFVDRPQICVNFSKVGKFWVASKLL